MPTSTSPPTTAATAVHTATTRTSAGSRRLARRAQNARRPTWCRSRCSRTRRVVMRKPDRTKKTSTPTYPPGNVAGATWNATTTATASARRPSSPGARRGRARARGPEEPRASGDRPPRGSSRAEMPRGSSSLVRDLPYHRVRQQPSPQGEHRASGDRRTAVEEPVRDEPGDGAPSGRGQDREVETLVQPHAEHRLLEPALVPREELTPGGGARARLEQRRVPARVLHVPPSHADPGVPGR